MLSRRPRSASPAEEHLVKHLRSGQSLPPANCRHVQRPILRNERSKVVRAHLTRLDSNRPQIMCDYPLNLSILMREGKETN